MVTKLLTGGLIVVLLASACTDREAEARKAREAAEAKVRAEAARKEMDALPKAFKSRDYFKTNDSAKVPAPATAQREAKTLN